MSGPRTRRSHLGSSKVRWRRVFPGGMTKTILSWPVHLTRFQIECIRDIVSICACLKTLWEKRLSRSHVRHMLCVSSAHYAFKAPENAFRTVKTFLSLGKPSFTTNSIKNIAGLERRSLFVRFSMSKQAVVAAIRNIWYYATHIVTSVSLFDNELHIAPYDQCQKKMAAQKKINTNESTRMESYRHTSGNNRFCIK